MCHLADQLSLFLSRYLPFRLTLLLISPLRPLPLLFQSRGWVNLFLSLSSLGKRPSHLLPPSRLSRSPFLRASLSFQIT